MTDASTEGQPTGVIEEGASPHMSYTTQVGLGSKRHDPSPVHAPLSNGIQFMGIYVVSCPAPSSSSEGAGHETSIYAEYD